MLQSIIVREYVVSWASSLLFITICRFRDYRYLAWEVNLTDLRFTLLLCHNFQLLSDTRDLLILKVNENEKE